MEQAGRLRTWKRLAIGFLAPVALLGAWRVARTQEPPKPDEKPIMATKKYKNIKVLKSLTADELIKAMHGFNDALGEKCGFCHVINPDHSGFDLDTKATKDIARQMIIMTNGLNKQYAVIRKQATCYLCHHGKPEPETKPQ